LRGIERGADATARTWTGTEPPANDADDYCNNPFFILSSAVLTPPQAAVCTSCHDAPYTAAHAATMTAVATVIFHKFLIV